MAFEMKHKDDIQASMTEEFEKISDITAVEGSFSRDIINANSIEFENAYAEMNLMMQANFADSSWGKYLTMRVAEFGIDRKKATKAVGEITATGEPNSTIPKNSLFETKNKIKFWTDSEAVINKAGSVNIKITCKEAGTTGNVEANTITQIPMSIPGVRSVTNEKATYDGFNEETEKELLDRYMIVVRTPATSGNIYHYYNWTMSIEGVGGCRVLPLWNGAGTVKIIIINSAMQTASQDIIKKVADYIESVRPIGATVTVTSPTPLLINVTGNIVGKINKTDFIKDLAAYIVEQNLNLKYLSVSQVIKIIMKQDTVKDCDNIKINNLDKVTIKDNELLAVGEVVLNEFNT